MTTTLGNTTQLQILSKLLRQKIEIFLLRQRRLFACDQFSEDIVMLSS